MSIESPQPEVPAGANEELRQRYEKLVKDRTGGMIHNLRIELLGNEIIMTGNTQTYYAKQLALHAIMNSVDDGYFVTNAIEV
jgi:hypothetical protein